MTVCLLRQMANGQTPTVAARPPCTGRCVQILVGGLPVHVRFNGNKACTDQSQQLMTQPWSYAALRKVEYTSPVDNVTYTLYHDLASWTTAQMVCRASGLELVTIVSDAQAVGLNLAFKSLHPGGNASFTSGFWVGGSDSAQEGAWTWADGSPFQYTRWGSNENSGPSVGVEDCLMATSNNGTWADQPCSMASPFVCSPPGVQRCMGPEAYTSSQLQRFMWLTTSFYVNLCRFWPSLLHPVWCPVPRHARRQELD
jgi:hypothetical protein